MEAAKVLECIEIAKRRRGIKKPLVIHSDQGVQYTSEEYKNKTEGMERSYSRKGNPWDNACIESFHSLIKREWINFYHFETIGFSINGAALKPLKIQVVECHKKNNLNSRMRRNEKWQSNMTKNLRNR
ncbi:hypothetical protein BO225_07365 [Dubosiella newyorkensis]|uniref:Integrase catalytic domain-containing protein n=3 Tax=Dubosiella newyorkensis TaxID=1862672 RepID=A0A1U7NLX0_9FIRM|nr:hypothetical protein BO225_07365 [Dubosiella newyorkensis]